ncbi:unnamed protein product, partial [Nesidiocoris tenuis]
NGRARPRLLRLSEGKQLLERRYRYNGGTDLFEVSPWLRCVSLFRPFPELIRLFVPSQFYELEREGLLYPCKSHQRGNPRFPSWLLTFGVSISTIPLPFIPSVFSSQICRVNPFNTVYRAETEESFGYIGVGYFSNTPLGSRTIELKGITSVPLDVFSALCNVTAGKFEFIAYSTLFLRPYLQSKWIISLTSLSSFILWPEINNGTGGSVGGSTMFANLSSSQVVRSSLRTLTTLWKGRFLGIGAIPSVIYGGNRNQEPPHTATVTVT